MKDVKICCNDQEIKKHDKIRITIKAKGENDEIVWKKSIKKNKEL